MLAIAVISTRLAHGTRSHVILAISALKTSGTNAFVIISLIQTFGVVFTRLLGTSLSIDLACFAFEPWSAFAMKLFPVIDTFSFISTEILMFPGCDGTRPFVQLAIDSLKTGFAGAVIFCACMGANSFVLTRVTHGTRPSVLLARFTRKSRFTLAEEIFALVDAFQVVFAGIFGAGSLIDLTFFTAETLFALTNVIGSFVKTFAMNARFADGTGPFVYTACFSNEPNWTLTREIGSVMDTFAIMQTRISDCARPLIILAVFTHEPGRTCAFVVQSQIATFAFVLARIFAIGARPDILLAIFPDKAHRTLAGELTIW